MLDEPSSDLLYDIVLMYSHNLLSRNFFNHCLSEAVLVDGEVSNGKPVLSEVP